MFSKNTFNDAVSPVVAVILMVAVTVILAAVIGSFVLDLGDDISSNPQAGVSINQMPSDDMWDAGSTGTNDATGYTVTFQIISMENADEVRVEYANNDAVEDVWTDGSTAGETYAPDPTTQTEETVGAEMTFDHLTPGDTLTVIGTLDGKEAVLQTYTVE